MKEKIESVMLMILGVYYRFKEWYFRWFPLAAVVFALVYAYGLAGTSDRGLLSVSDIPRILMVIAFFTIAVMLYIILLLKKQLGEKR